MGLAGVSDYEHDTATCPDCQPVESLIEQRWIEQRERALRALRYRQEGPAAPR